MTVPSLDEFAEGDAAAIRPGVKSRIDALPDDVKAQILASSAGHSVTARWLRTVAPDAKITEGMVLHWRNQRGWSRD